MMSRIQQRTSRQVIVSTHSTDLLLDEGIGLDEVLLLTPGEEGTEAKQASEFEDVRALLEGGATLAEAVLPKTRPTNAAQLTLFSG